MDCRTECIGEETGSVLGAGFGESRHIHLVKCNGFYNQTNLIQRFPLNPRKICPRVKSKSEPSQICLPVSPQATIQGEFGIGMCKMLQVDKEVNKMRCFESIPVCKSRCQLPTMIGFSEPFSGPSLSISPALIL